MSTDGTRGPQKPGHKDNNGQDWSSIQNLILSGLDIYRAVVRAHPGVESYLSELNQAAMAAKEAAVDAKGASSGPGGSPGANGANADVVRLLKNGMTPLQQQLQTALNPVIRKAVADVVNSKLAGVLSKTIQKSLGEAAVKFAEQLDDVIAAAKEKLVEEDVQRYLRDESPAPQIDIGPLQQEIRALTKLVQGVVQAQLELVQRAEEAMVPTFAPAGSLLNRYFQQQAEKVEMGRYVAQTFFKQTLRAFVMASSSTIHMAQQLRTAAIPGGCYFQTNSIVFPVALLGDSSQHVVTPFWGPIYDEECGGWLPNLDDPPTVEALKALFTDVRWNLSTSFVVPRKVSVEHGMYFVRPQAARLATILAESSPHLVILALADRLCRSLPEPERPGSYRPRGSWSEGPDRKASLIISGTRASDDLPALVDEFAWQGLAVHYQDPGTGEWAVRG